MILDSLANAVFTQLELASSVKAQSLEPMIRHGKSEGGSVPKVSASFRRYRWAYRRAKTHEERRRLVREAEDELREIRYSRRPDIDTGTREGRLLIGRDQRPVRIVAKVYGYSERHVHRLRAEAVRFEGDVRRLAA